MTATWTPRRAGEGAWPGAHQGPQCRGHLSQVRSREGPS